MSQSPPYQGYGNPYSNSKPQLPYTQNAEYNASTTSLGRNSFQEQDTSPLKAESKGATFTVDMRQVNRTPSPTPSEAAELTRTGFFDWKTMAHWKYWFRREWLWYYVIGVLVVTFTILITVFHSQIVAWLQPAANWMHNLKGGFLIPIAIFFVISFPPLFGHEILAILVGVVWGLWGGFAITAVGTLIGEIGNFYAFRYCCSARGEKMEKEKISYASLARVVREGGFKIALIARYSAIPGHFTTAVFSTCGMGFWTFFLAAFLSLPKQFVTVYLGVSLEQGANAKPTTANNVVKYLLLLVTTVVTVLAMWYISKKMNAVKPDVIYARRKARQQKLNDAPFGGYSGPSTFNANDSESALPLTSKPDGNYQHQQWDSNGRAVGFSGDPTLFAPQPQRVALGPFTPKTAPAPPSSSNVRVVPPSAEGRDKYSSPSSAPALYRQDTDNSWSAKYKQDRQDSTQSWNAQATVGTHDVYQMTRQQSPPSDPFAELPLPPRLPPPGSPQTSSPHQQYSQPQYAQPQYSSSSPVPQKMFSIPPPPGLSLQQASPQQQPSIPQYSPPQYNPQQQYQRQY